VIRRRGDHEVDVLVELKKMGDEGGGRVSRMDGVGKC